MNEELANLLETEQADAILTGDGLFLTQAGAAKQQEEKSNGTI
jgi:hypothetical protein